MDYSYNEELTLKVIDDTKGILLELRKGSIATIEVQDHIFTGIVDNITEMGLTLINTPFETKHIETGTTIQYKQIYQIALYDIKSIYKNGEPVNSEEIYYIISPAPYLTIVEEIKYNNTIIRVNDDIKVIYVEHSLEDHFILGSRIGKVIEIDKTNNHIIVESEIVSIDMRENQEYITDVISKDNPTMLLSTIPLYVICTIEKIDTIYCN